MELTENTNFHCICLLQMKYICCRFKLKTKNGSPGDFSLIRLPCFARTEVVVSPFVDQETNGSYPFASGLAHPWG
jgi:hypothetical protein